MDTVFESDIFSMDIDITPILGPITGFKEFCEDLNLLDYMVTPDIYTEAINNVDKRVGFRQAMQNTRETTAAVADTYGNVTDAGGNLLKTVVDLVAEAFSLLSRLFAFILKQIAKIPLKLRKLLKIIGSIPDKLFAKIRGDVLLYLSANDVATLSNDTMWQIHEFISYVPKMSKGDTWGTFLSKINGLIGNSPVPKKESIPNNDMQIFSKMKKVYKKIEKIVFVKSRVKMESDDIVRTYFSDNKTIGIFVPNRSKVDMSYIEAMNHLLDIISENKNALTTAAGMFDAKISRTRANESLADLSRKQQGYIRDSVKMISKVVNILGNIIKYINIDIATIQKGCNKILSRVKQDGVKVKRVDKDHIETKYGIITKSFSNDCISGKKTKVRKTLKELMITDLTFEKSDVYIKYAEDKFSDLYDEHNEKITPFEKNRTNWTENTIIEQMAALDNNFSRERVEYLRRVISQVHAADIEKINKERLEKENAEKEKQNAEKAEKKQKEKEQQEKERSEAFEQERKRYEELRKQGNS